MGLNFHWWRRLYGEENWGVRQCRICRKKELAMYRSETSSIEWISVNDNT